MKSETKKSIKHGAITIGVSTMMIFLVAFSTIAVIPVAFHWLETGVIDRAGYNMFLGYPFYGFAFIFFYGYMRGKLDK